jgi:hypothetical protein
MNKPVWQERSFEGRQVRFTALATEESEMTTRIGTRWAVPAQVEILSGMFTGAVYERVPVFSPRLKAQMLESGSVAGILKRGPALEGAGIQWLVKEMPVQG